MACNKLTNKHVCRLLKHPLFVLALGLLCSVGLSAQNPPPTQGPGGPVLVVTTSTDPFGTYYAEILRNEGFNLFSVADISTVTATTLNNYDVVILAGMPLTSAQVSMFTNWVNGGGRLIAMRPDKQLASLLGLADAGSTLASAYLLVNTTSGPGVGIVNQTIQFHGAADLYALNGATGVATLYSNSSTATSNPAVTLTGVGPNGGQAAAFAYDLARSVVYTRQGNPAWSGQRRDGQTIIRPDDLFFGAASFDLEPDWVDLNKVAIPQADEQQRLLANLILYMNSGKKPLPKFWYFPRAFKAVIIMTGDDHSNGGTAGRFNTYISQSASGCNVANWECIRSTSYIFTEPTLLTNAQAASYNSQGFEVALHINTDCADWTPSTLASYYSTQISNWKATYVSLPSPVTNRTHCVAWSDYATQPQVELNNGMRLDTTYYYWPDSWIQDRPGMFTGSGMPMRFADLNGNLIDVYQATTQMTDESGQTYPLHVNTLLDNALGSLGYYGAFTVNAHTDSATSAVSSAVVSSALARNVPIVSARQMLNWLDGRNASSFGSLGWNGQNLSFNIALGSGTAGLLQAMVPTKVAVGSLSGITLNGAPIAFTKQTIKGVEYAFFAAQAGSYVAKYTPDATGPVISNVTASSVSYTSAVISWTTDDPSDTQVEYGTTTAYGSSTPLDTLLVNNHSKPLSGLTTNTTYHFRVKSRNGAGLLTVSGDFTFTTPLLDLSPPVISNVSASVITNIGAKISWITNEVSDTQVDYGTSTAYGSSTPLNSTLLTSHAVTLTGLSPDTVYHCRVKSRDPAGNLGVSADFTFTTMSAVRTDTTVSDFTSGTPDAKTYISLITDGELLLNPALGVEFSGTTLPTGWTFTPSNTGGTGTVGSSVLSVDGGLVVPPTFYAPGRSLEFVATFSGATFQHVGFGNDLSGPPWAIFSTSSGGGLWARTNTGSSTDQLLSGNWIGAPHRFRIDWNQNSVVYWIDGAQVASHALTISTNMRPLVSDYSTGGGKVTVDWMHLTPYATPATFLSRVLNAPSDVSWGAAIWTADTSAAGTSLAVSVRTGETPTPDSSWTPFASLASSGSSVGAVARYLQYQVQLSTSNPAQTPVFNDVSFFFSTSTSTPPDTTITSNPAALSNSSSASFSFTATKVGSTFQCSLDGAAFATCTSPQSYTTLTEGSHTFQVKATDAVGNTDPTPASFTWTVDTVAPDTTITANPPAQTNSTSASFSFTSTEAGGTFQCSLDGAAFATCTSPQSYPSVANGSHTFQVRATDAAGNTDATPASYTWTVDATAPDTTITANPPAQTNSTSANFSFTATKVGSTFQCSLDGAAFATCTSPQSYSGLGNGNHTFQVKATDAVGNTDPTPASFTWTVDTVAPDTTITANPPAQTNSTTASFSFTSTEAGSTFQCSLDGAAFVACTSPQTYASLTNAGHTFQVRATDPTGNTDPTPASFTWTVDTVAPGTTITANPPALTNSSSASFSFTSTQAGSTFQCSLDGAAFLACTSPQSYTSLVDGSHAFQVRATDPAGNTDPTPASFTWTVDTVAPDTTITANPPALTNSTSASFSFTSTPTGGTFQCSLDGAAFAACTSPKSYTGLTNGSHTFQVRATDPAGNTDPTPASFTWTVDTVAPTTTITAKPPARTNSTGASFSFTSSEVGSTFQCRLDGGGFATCTSPQTYTNLADGSHTFRVRAKDPAGNTGSAASYTWTVDTVAPNTTITANPAAQTNSTSASFSFTSTQSGSTFQCSLDGAAFAACTSPKSYTGLTNGSHTFQVQATDNAGNTDPTPASYTWTVDTVAPVVSNVAVSSITISTAVITWTTDEPSNSQVQYGTTTAYGSTTPLDSTLAASHVVNLSGLTRGTLYHFRVKSSDAAGNLTNSADFTFTTSP